MEIIAFWIILSLIMGAWGSGKEVGFAGGFILSLILSPLLGAIIVAISPAKKEDVPQPAPSLQATIVQQPNTAMIADELAKLRQLHQDGLLTEDELHAQKKKLLGTT